MTPEDSQVIHAQEQIIGAAHHVKLYGNVAQRAWASLIIMEAKWQIRKVRERNS